jgi:hypothetical protein
MQYPQENSLRVGTAQSSRVEVTTKELHQSSVRSQKIVNNLSTLYEGNVVTWSKFLF